MALAQLTIDADCLDQDGGQMRVCPPRAVIGVAVLIFAFLPAHEHGGSVVHEKRHVVRNFMHYILPALAFMYPEPDERGRAKIE